VGFIHALRITPAGILPHIGWGTASSYAQNYLLFAALFLFVHVWRKKRGYLSSL
jgi:hypothetical protein